MGFSLWLERERVASALTVVSSNCGAKANMLGTTCDDEQPTRGNAAHIKCT